MSEKVKLEPPSAERVERLGELRKAILLSACTAYRAHPDYPVITCSEDTIATIGVEDILGEHIEQTPYKELRWNMQFLAMSGLLERDDYKYRITTNGIHEVESDEFAGRYGFRI